MFKHILAATDLVGVKDPVVTDPEALISWDENAPNDLAIGKEKDRAIHVFTGKGHESL